MNSSPDAPAPSDAEDLSPALAERLRELARAAAARSYSPYSGFRVGAALLLAAPHQGVIVTACNVENTSFRLSVCAEQAAIARAVAELGPGIRLRAVAVANLNGAASTPCGACRQTLLEFAPDPSSVLVHFPGLSPDGSVTNQSRPLADLLPAGFAFHRPASAS